MADADVALANRDHAGAGERSKSSQLPASKELEALVKGLPIRTATPHGTPSDLVNVLLLGSEEAV
jgi:hypothetical protein